MLRARSPLVVTGALLLVIGATRAFGGAALASDGVRATPNDRPCAIPLRLVSSALGVPVVRRTPIATDGAKICKFASGTAIPYATIATSRQATVAAAAALYRMQLDVAAGNVAGKPMTLHGIGDEAATIDGFLYARKGAALYQFGIVDFGPQPRDLPTVQRLAKAVLATVTP